MKRSFGKNTITSKMGFFIGLIAESFGFGGNTLSGTDPLTGVRRIMYAKGAIGSWSRVSPEAKERFIYIRKELAEDKREMRRCRDRNNWQAMKAGQSGVPIDYSC